MSLRKPGNRTRSAPLALISLAAFAVAAGGQEKAPRNPPEPFRVFVHAIEVADAALKVRLDEALPMVRERVERRRKWFQLTGSAETADITLRVVNYRTGRVPNPPHRRTGGTMPGLLVAQPSGSREYHFVDAVVRSGGVTAKLSGLDEGPIGSAVLGRVAGQLVKELERFAKDNYGALSRLRAGAEVGERADGGAPPMQPGN